MFRNLFYSLSAVFMIAALLPAQNDKRDISPFPHLINDNQTNTLSMWDLEFSFNVTEATGASGNAGAECDGIYFYTTRWSSNLIHKFDMSGNLIEEFSIPGVSGLRDLAFDGMYMYGGSASYTIYQMDFNTKTLIGTISSPVAVRFIAYDEISDAFWCGNWADDPTLVSRTGQNLNSFSTGLTAQYGAAFDDITAGGNYLWIFDQGGGVCPGSLMVYAFEISTGTYTGQYYDVCIDLTNGIAGGLFTTIDYIAGVSSIGGIIQSNSGLDDTFFIYDLAPCSVAPPSNPDPPDNAEGISVNLSQLSWSNSPGDIVSELYFGPDPDSLTLVQGGEADSSWSITSNYLPLEYLTTYYWTVTNYGTPCSPTNAEWSFITEPDPTPVELILFRADFSDGMVILSWTTASETNNKGFEVQRLKAEDPKLKWKDIGFVEGKGSSTEKQEYTFSDTEVSAGKYTYRLKQTDLNGSFNFSEEVTIEIRPVFNYYLAQNYPNPFNPSTTIKYGTREKGNVTIELFNIIGQGVKTILNEEREPGNYSVEFDIADLPSGVYIYKINAGNFTSVKKMILMK